MKETPNKHKTAIILINTGSPVNPGVFQVARYLSRFLGDRRIIGLPWFFRKLLVNGIIVPFRSPRSAVRYRRLWNMYDRHFPLTLYGESTKNKLQEVLGNDITVFSATCYGQPSIPETVRQIIDGRFSRLIILPVFPQYASSSTGAALEKSLNELKRYPLIPEIRTIHSFYNHPAFIKAFAERIRNSKPENYDKILFTFHSLPLSQAREVTETCADYPKACSETARLLARELNLPDEQWEMVYQSQLSSSSWLGPFADRRIPEMGKQGVKNLLIVAASFVTNCLENTLELGEEYKQLFLDHGGEKFTLAESLNDSALWIQCLKELVLTQK